MFSNALYLITIPTIAPMISWVADDSPSITTTDGTWSSIMPITSTTYQWLSSSDNVNWASTPFNTSTQDFFGINNIYVKSIVTVITSIKTLTAESNVINTGNVALRVPTLLLNADIIQSISRDTFLDSSTNNFTITRNGTTTQGSFSPYALNGVAYNPSVHGGSAYFNGTTDYLDCGAAILNTTGNFTIECWIYVTGKSGTQRNILGQYINGDPNRTNLGVGADNKVYWSTLGSINELPSLNAISENIWTHVCIVRNGSGSNNTSMYINGIVQGSYTDTSNFAQTNTWIGQGQGYSAGLFVGYISNLRITTTAIYTSNFALPTSPLTLTSNGGATPSTAPTSGQVALLCDFTNSSIVDSAAKNDLTTVGNVKVSTFVKYGAGSLYFDGSSYLTVPASSNFNFANGTAFTVEFFINPLSLKTGTGNDGFATIISTAKVHPNGWRIEIGPTGIMFYTYSNSAVITTPISLNTWTHIAIVHDGTTTKMYKDGVLNGSAAATWAASTSDLVIGGLMSGPYTYYYNGYIDDLRITKGITRYTSDFTPPAAALPNTTVGDPNMNDVVLLLQADLILPMVKDTFLDSSTNDFAITDHGVSQGSFGPFPVTVPVYDPLVNGGSGYFNGGGHLSAPNSSSFNFGTGDFTVECWVNIKSYGISSGRALLDTRPDNTNGNYWLCSITTTGNLRVNLGNTGTPSEGTNMLTSTSQIPLNTWTHVACTRSSGTVKLYINGNLDKTGSLIGNSGSSQLLIGTGAYRSTAPDQFFHGYISDVRIIKETARAITSAPTAPLTNIADTSILLNFTNGLIIDSAAKTNVYYKTDSTTINDSNPKYGIGSIYCSTFGDRTIFLSPASGDILGIGTKSFTIECWYKLIEVSSMGSGFIFTYSVSGNNNLLLAVNSSGAIGLWLGHHNYGASAAGVVPLNTWCHIALVRNGTSVNIYVDGTSVLTATNSSSIGINMTPCINGYAHDARYGNICYIDDFRILKNCAFYKNNFTPSSVPLTFP